MKILALITIVLINVHSIKTEYSNDINQRIMDTISCQDCNYIPKVISAGKEITINDSSYQVMHNGLKIITNSYHPWMTDIIKQLKGHHEPQEEKVFFEVLKSLPSNATMLELGSFWAYYSMWFHKAIPHATNYLVEPNPEKLLVGKRHFAINACNGHFIAGFIDQLTNYDTSFVDWDKKVYQVPQLCIDDIIQTNFIDFINILHCDIQGNEYKMLLGARQSIALKKIGYLFISTHATADNPHQQCLTFLKAHDFHIVASHTLGESFSGDGLIVARPNWLPGLDYVEISKK